MLKMHVMHDIEEYRKAIGMSYTQLAELVTKDAAVIKRQLTETKGGVQLNTAYELAAAIGGEVRFISPKQIDNIGASERESLNEQITTLTATNAQQEEDLAKMRETVSILQKRIIKMDERLERKDELIRKLLIEKGVIE